MLVTMNIWVFLLLMMVAYISGIVTDPIGKIINKFKGDKKNSGKEKNH